MNVIFVQEPMERLVSIWKNKIYTPKAQYYYDRYVKSIIRNYLGRFPPNLAHDAWNQNLRIDFQTFVKWLVVSDQAYYLRDEIFKPITQLCPVCSFQLKFIGHTGNFTSEIQ